MKTLFLLCQHGFDDFNLNKLWGEVFNTNVASLLIFKRMGFCPSPGHIQHYFRNGDYINTTFFNMLAPDWFKSNLLGFIADNPNKDIFMELGRPCPVVSE